MAEVNPITGVVLAGGRSRRFGSNKALAPWGRTTVLQTICETLGSIFSDVLVIVKEKSCFPSIPLGRCRLVEDRFKAHHALGGIVTALEASQSDTIFLTACDAPLLQPELVRFLCSRHAGSPATIPVWAGRMQPLTAVYTKSALPILQAAVEKRRFKLRETLPELSPAWISDAELRWAGINGRSFFDVDTKADYEFAKKMTTESLR